MSVMYIYYLDDYFTFNKDPLSIVYKVSTDFSDNFTIQNKKSVVYKINDKTDEADSVRNNINSYNHLCSYSYREVKIILDKNRHLLKQMDIEDFLKLCTGSLSITDWHTKIKLAEYSYRNGLLDGESSTYHHNYSRNNLCKKMFYRGGLKQGLEQEFNNCLLIRETYYDADKIVEEKTFYGDGSIREHYIDGKTTSYTKSGNIKDPKRINGKYIDYHPNGKIKEVSNYKDGKLHGEFLSYYKDGSSSVRAIYIDGKYDYKHKTYKDGKNVEEIYTDGVKEIRNIYRCGEMWNWTTKDYTKTSPWKFKN